jgi:F-type H+-transporting ATPase subunit delta
VSEYHTIARPYAQAVFELAKDSDDFQSWSPALALLAALAENSEIRELVQNPRVDNAALAQLFEDICGDKLFDQAQSFLRLIIGNERVFSLPNIASQFETLRAEAEGTIDAELITAQPVTDAQRLEITESLSRRLGREVNLRVTENTALIGGAVLRAGDMVIDASVKGRLQKLAANLAH